MRTPRKTLQLTKRFRPILSRPSRCSHWERWKWDQHLQLSAKGQKKAPNDLALPEVQTNPSIILYVRVLVVGRLDALLECFMLWGLWWRILMIILCRCSLYARQPKGRLEKAPSWWHQLPCGEHWSLMKWLLPSDTRQLYEATMPLGLTLVRKFF